MVEGVARRNEGSKHPASAAKILSERGKSDLASIKDSDLFRGLGHDQQRFLSYYLVYRDYKKAATEARVTLAWAEEQEHDEDFLQIVEEVIQQPLSFAEMLAQEAAPMAVLTAIDLMQNARSEIVRLNAAKHIHNIVGMITPEGTPVNPVQVQNVLMFTRKQPELEDANIIDAPDD
jgi:hypothetical protein